jgi:nucleotide-binding universal stress UspA family protein
LSRIVLATDLTIESDAATDYAKILARKFHSLILIVHIIDEALRSVFATAMGRSTSGRLQTLKKELLRVKSNISGAGIQTREILYEGHPVNSVLTMLARQRKADLIVVAANQDLAEAELSTLAMLEDVLPACKCPLIVVGMRMNRARVPDLSSAIYVETGASDGDAYSYSEAFADLAGATLTTLKVKAMDSTEEATDAEPDSDRKASVQSVVDAVDERRADLIICSLSKKKHVLQPQQLQFVRDLILLLRCPVMILCS